MTTLGQLRRSCSTLGSDQLTAILQLILKYDEIPADDQPLTHGECLVLWVADLLEGLKLCSRDTLLVFLQQHHKMLTLYGNEAGYAYSNPGYDLLDRNMGVADRTYVIVQEPLKWKYFHLQTQEQLEKMPYRPLETIVYDLNVLFANQYRASRVTEAEEQEHGSDTGRNRAEPADRDRESAPHG